MIPDWQYTEFYVQACLWVQLEPECQDWEQVSWSAGSFLLWRVCTREASSISLQLMRRIASVAVSPFSTCIMFPHVHLNAIGHEDHESHVDVKVERLIPRCNVCQNLSSFGSELKLCVWESTYLLEWHWTQDKLSTGIRQVMNPLQAKRAITPSFKSQWSGKTWKHQSLTCVFRPSSINRSHVDSLSSYL